MVFLLDKLAKSDSGMFCGKFVIQKETRDMSADPRNSQNATVHHSGVQTEQY